MTYALVALSHSTLGGIYYTLDFTTTGAQPVWGKLTTSGLPSLEPDIFRVDYGDPLSIQYLGFGVRLTGADGSIYGRNAGNWSLLMDKTIASTVTGATITGISWLWTDPMNYGHVFTVAYRVINVLQCQNWILKSTDYGATWAVMGVMTEQQEMIRNLNVIGNYIWGGVAASLGAEANVIGSANGGANWDIEVLSVGKAWPSTTIDTNDPSRCWGSTVATGLSLCTIVAPATITEFAYAGPSDNDHQPDYLWADPNTAGHAVLCNNATIYYTVDSFQNSTQTVFSNLLSGQIQAITNFWNGATTDLVFGHDDSGVIIYHIDSQTDTTVANRSGANSTVPPYVDSLPQVGLICEYGIWAGSPPADKGVYVYSVEEDVIADLPTYTGLGTPMFGDRGSWRDMDADNDGISPATTPLSYYHAQDIQAGTPQRHNPWPAASGFAPVSDGAKYVATDIATQAELNAHAALPNIHHDAVTLDADAAVLLDLSTQEIGLDVQNANTVFAGPTVAPANEPTFRALGLTDLPAIALNDLSDVNTAGVASADALVYDGANWVPGDGMPPSTLHGHMINEDHSAECDGAETAFPATLAFIAGSTAVYLNGLRQRLNIHYTEDGTLDGITMDTPPEAGDEFVWDYLVSYPNWLIILSALNDSDNIALADSDNELLNDSL